MVTYWKFLRTLGKIIHSGVASYHCWKLLGINDILLLTPTVALHMWILVTKQEPNLKQEKGSEKCHGKEKNLLQLLEFLSGVRFLD